MWVNFKVTFINEKVGFDPVNLLLNAMVKTSEFRDAGIEIDPASISKKINVGQYLLSGLKGPICHSVEWQMGPCRSEVTT